MIEKIDWLRVGFVSVFIFMFSMIFLKVEQRINELDHENYKLASQRQASIIEAKQLLIDMDNIQGNIINNCHSLAPRWGVRKEFCEEIKFDK